jgi:hypothetical protein
MPLLHDRVVGESGERVGDCPRDPGFEFSLAPRLGDFAGIPAAGFGRLSRLAAPVFVLVACLLIETATAAVI